MGTMTHRPLANNGANTSLNTIYNKKKEMRYSRSPEGVREGSPMATKDHFTKTLETPDKAISSSAGFTMANNNHFVSQKAQPKPTDRINFRRSSFNYDCEQPPYLRIRENPSKSVKLSDIFWQSTTPNQLNSLAKTAF